MCVSVRVSVCVDMMLYVIFLLSAKAIWSLRERLAEALMHDGYCYKYDVSLPLSSFYQLVLDMRQRVSGSAKRVIGYGHVGDGEHEGEFGGGCVVVLFLDSDTYKVKKNAIY